MDSAAMFFILISVCLCGLAAAQNPMQIPNPLMYPEDQYKPATLGLSCDKEGFLLDFQQFQGAKEATLTVGSLENTACQFKFLSARQPYIADFKKCGAEVSVSKGQVTYSSHVKVVQEYAGPVDQKFNWITCAQYNLTCCFEPKNPNPGNPSIIVPEASVCANDNKFNYTVWFVPQPGVYYYHMYVNTINVMYEVVPHTCRGTGRTNQGQRFDIPLISNGCVLDDSRLRLSVTKLSEKEFEYYLTSADPDYQNIVVNLNCATTRCRKPAAPVGDGNLCSSYWQGDQLKSCLAPYVKPEPHSYSVQIDPESTVIKKDCKKKF